MSRELRVFSDENVVSKELSAFVVQSANEAITQRGIFTIGLSGGSASKYLSDNLPKLNTEWNKWRVFFCDERHVGYDDPDCTYGYYKKNLLEHVPIPQDCVFPDNPHVSVEDAAKEYTDKLRNVFGHGIDFPRFDLLILGMGPDGHTCSLFPDHPLLQENNLWVASISDSPKPPSQRITMTMPVLLNSRIVVFAACGDSKASMVKSVLEGDELPPLPSAMVKPHSGRLIWFLDCPAARLLSGEAT